MSKFHCSLHSSSYTLSVAQRVAEAGGRMEIVNLWGDMSENRPHPQWRVFLDTWLNLPYPAWYREYYMLHAEHDCPPNLSAPFFNPLSPKGSLIVVCKKYLNFLRDGD